MARGVVTGPLASLPKINAKMIDENPGGRYEARAAAPLELLHGRGSSAAGCTRTLH
jgi:hypothetical protein